VKLVALIVTEEEKDGQVGFTNTDCQFFNDIRKVVDDKDGGQEKTYRQYLFSERG
jgi:hypothetical protein